MFSFFLFACVFSGGSDSHKNGQKAPQGHNVECVKPEQARGHFGERFSLQDGVYRENDGLALKLQFYT